MTQVGAGRDPANIDPNAGLPEGEDVPPESDAQAAAESQLEESAAQLEARLTDASATPQEVRTATHAFQNSWNASGRSPRLTLDGVYGPATRAALSTALGRDAPAARATTTATSRSQARAQQSPPPSAQTPPPIPTVPNYLGPALALAYWSVRARASDTTANSKLAALASNAAWINAHSNTGITSGGTVRIGEVPAAPDDATVAQWAQDAWSRAQAAGASTVAQLTSHARSIVSQAQSALAEITRAISRETDIAVRQSLSILEATLTAILRPVAHGIDTATRGLAGPALLLGAGLLLFSSSSHR